MLGCGLCPLPLQGMTKRGAVDSKGPDKKRSKVEEREEGGGAVQKIEDVDTDASYMRGSSEASGRWWSGSVRGGARWLRVG